jgi:Domain of unknown function (DUF397)
MPYAVRHRPSFSREVAVLGSEGHAGSDDVPSQVGGAWRPEFVGVSWRKSSWSTYNGNCVEVGSLRDSRIAVRDTKDREAGPVLIFTRSEWNAFLAGTKQGEFDSY